MSDVLAAMTLGATSVVAVVATVRLLRPPVADVELRRAGVDAQRAEWARVVDRIARPRRRRLHLRVNRRWQDPPELRRLVLELGWATTSARQLDQGLRPRLLRTAQALQTHAGSRTASADARPRLARLSPAAGALLDPTRERSTDDVGPGLDLRALDEVLDHLETL